MKIKKREKRFRRVIPRLTGVCSIGRTHRQESMNVLKCMCNVNITRSVCVKCTFDSCEVERSTEITIDSNLLTNVSSMLFSGGHVLVTTDTFDIDEIRTCRVSAR
jgi:hypothetical protein